MQLQPSLINGLILLAIYCSCGKVARDFIKLLVIILLFCSCSKRTVDLEAIKNDVRIISSIDSSTRVKLQTKIETRSVHITDEQSDYQVRIIPKGVFKFSQAGGFEGEAESILITGKVSKSEKTEVNTKKLQDSVAETKLKKKDDLKTSSKLRAKKVEATGPSWWKTPLLILIILAAIWFFTPFKRIFVWLRSSFK